MKNTHEHLPTLEEMFLIITREKYAYLKNILEGYDSLCCLSSVDMNRGVVCLRFPKEVRADIFGLLNRIADKLNSLKT